MYNYNVFIYFFIKEKGEKNLIIKNMKIKKILKGDKI